MRTEDHKAKVDQAVAWFIGITEDQKEAVARELFDHAIVSEWVNVWSKEDAEELSEESGKPISFFNAPYFTTCGEPLIDVGGE